MPNAVFNCPTCSRPMRLPDTLLGRPVACPTCRNVFTASFAPNAPAPQQLPLPSPETPPAASGSLLTTSASYDVELAPSSSRHPCPICGEAILPSARKCKHCGEVVDPWMRREIAISSEERHAGRNDVGGTISLVFGSIALVCTALMLFTCGFSIFAAIPFSVVGLVLAFFGRGQLKIAGLVLNLVALATTTMAGVLVLVGVLARR